MLDGFDANWHFIENRRNGRYTNLPGGEYTLLLKGSNSDGVWTESAARINIRVIPPFWQTTWFQVILSVTVVAAVFGGFRLRTKKIQDRNRPLLATGDPLARLRQLYRERDPLYREVADLVVDTGRQSVQVLTRGLLEQLATRWKASA